MPADKVISAKIGEPILDVAKKAGVEIPTKCMKGECGTCEVNINGKWVKSCQETGALLICFNYFYTTSKTVIFLCLQCLLLEMQEK